MNENYRLVQRLQKRQKQLNLNHVQFAAKLGVSRSAWNFVRTGQKPPGLIVLSGIVKAFPEMGKEVVFFLRTYDTNVSDDISVSGATAEQEPAQVAS
jgi:transcriptional regulator with XRE-family HTH domain